MEERKLRAHVSQVDNQSMEERLNGFLEEGEDALCKARRYERKAELASTRAGDYQWSFQTTSAQLQLRVPKLRPIPFETAVIER